MKRHFRSRGKKGFILVSVLISTGLLLTIATGLAWYAKTELARTSSFKFAFETRSVAETALTVVKTAILADTNDYDSFSEPLYSILSPMTAEIGNYRAEITVEPLCGEIPVRGLFLPDGVTLKEEYRDAWERIWEELGLPDTAARAADFMDSDNKQRRGGAEKETDINRVPLDISEFLALEGVDTGVLWGTSLESGETMGITDYLTVYGGEKLNINTAPPGVVALLDSRIDIAAAEALAYYRLGEPITKAEDLKLVPGFPRAAITKISNAIGFKSDYFRVTISVYGKNENSRNFRITVKKDEKSVRTVRWEE